MALTRRRFLKLGSAAGAGLLVPWQLSLGCGAETNTPSGDTTTADYRLPADIDRFIDPLPRPPMLAPDTGAHAGSDYYEISLTQFTQQLHSQLPPTPLWGYAGSFPGPTIEARRGRPVRIKWINDGLPATHLLHDSIDRTIDRGMTLPEVRTIAHLHGGPTPPMYDGLPAAWSTPGATVTGPEYNAGDFIYHNDIRACALWYHDHAMGITRLNVYAGLAGLYIVRDENEENLALPSGEYEIPILIQDRSFNFDGTLFYPTMGMTTIHPVWNMEFFGDTPVVNGRAFPYLEVEPRRYRFRLLNGSQSRFYNLRFDDAGKSLPFSVIGSDGGLLPSPAQLDKLLLAPAERADVIFDFSALPENTVITLRNDAPAPYPLGGARALPEIMQFRVNGSLSGDDRSAPAALLSLPAIEPLAATPGTPAREIVLVENLDASAIMAHGADTAGMGDMGGMSGARMGITELLINGKPYSDPVDEKPAAGTTEIWQFINATPDTHPLHLHLVQFQIVNRQPLDTAGYWTLWEAWRTGSGPKPVLEDFITGPAMPPAPEESGWKDTARAMPGEVLRIIARFTVPPGTELPARYVYHCHILEHEDNEMMRPFEVM
ncbi:MAG: multicopper oxidase domain-containing protein [Actinobacteria bacterium]|nr:multicopper oxidase domain-containing protein [Actinomycetota bacterium]